MLSTTQRRRSRSPVVLVSLLSLFAVAGCAIRAEPAPKGTPSATETLLAVSAGPQVVAVDSASTYPEKGSPHEAVGGSCRIRK
jgi:ABC-type hemin transport system substrate-binding protein